MNKHYKDQGNGYLPDLGDGYKWKHTLIDSDLGRMIKQSVQNAEGLYRLTDEAPSGFYCYRICSSNDDKCSLPSGVFHYHIFNHQYTLTPLKVELAQKVVSVDTDLTDEIKSFLKNKSYFDKIGAVFKRGYLLYGPPGTGKTTLVSQIIKESIPDDALVIYCSIIPNQELISIFNQDKRLKVFVFEELTQIEDVGKDRFLNFLDGCSTVSNAIYIGTTNYPELLPANIVQRPGRFDVVRRVDDMPKTVYKSLVELYCPDAWEVLEHLSPPFSTAHLKEIGTLCHLNNIGVDEALQRLADMSDAAKKEFQKERANGIGFN